MKDIKKEAYRLCKKMKLNSDEVYQEAECVKMYGEWIHLKLMGFSAETLYAVADILKSEGH